MTERHQYIRIAERFSRRYFIVLQYTHEARIELSVDCHTKDRKKEKYVKIYIVNIARSWRLIEFYFVLFFIWKLDEFIFIRILLLLLLLRCCCCCLRCHIGWAAIVCERVSEYTWELTYTHSLVTNESTTTIVTTTTTTMKTKAKRLCERWKNFIKECETSWCIAFVNVCECCVCELVRICDECVYMDAMRNVLSFNCSSLLFFFSSFRVLRHGKSHFQWAKVTNDARCCYMYASANRKDTHNDYVMQDIASMPRRSQKEKGWATEGGRVCMRASVFVCFRGLFQLYFVVYSRVLRRQKIKIMNILTF